VTTRNEGFVKWLLGEMEVRDWSQSDLARKADVSHARISQILSGDTPGTKILTRIARALHVPKEEILRQAGILPPLPTNGEKREAVKMMELFDRLAPAERERVLEYVEFLLSRGKR